jgi:hypothetical protein
MLISEVLKAGAERVRQGWCQYALEDYRGGVCAQGAILSVTEGCANPFFHKSVTAINWVRFGRATDYINRAINSSDITRWNNAPGQTAENVAQALELAAILAEQDERAVKADQPAAVAVSQ